MKSKEIQAIVDTMRRRNSDRKLRVRERVARATDFLPVLVAECRRIDPEIREIILFGSLSAGSVTGEDFDIDIAVSSNRYLTLVAWSLKQELPIDVVDIESVPNHILEEIREKGKVLYAR